MIVAMLEAPYVPIALGLSALVGVYWVCLIVGGGLLLISALGAAGDHGGVDVHDGSALDHHGDFGHAHAGSLTRWFSIRFVVFFLAVFGMIGVVLTHLTELSSWEVLLASMACGAVFGQAVHQIVRKVQRSSGDSTPRPEDYVDKVARVTIRIEPRKKGEVAVRAGPSDRFVPAVAKQPDQSFPVGAQVVVVAYQGGVAEVVAREEYEFLANSK